MEGQIRKQRQETIYKQQQMRRQLGEALAWLFLAIIIGGLLLLLASAFSSKAHGKDYTRNQKINNGTTTVPKMTTCRLKKQKVFKDKMACIYVGAQKTYELEFTDVHVGCPRNYQCVFNPNGQEPSIDKVMESLRSIAK